MLYGVVGNLKGHIQKGQEKFFVFHQLQQFKMLSRPMKGLLLSFIVVFFIAALALWVAKIPVVKYYGFEAVFFSVIFGLIIRNCFGIPEWLKPAIQGEYFIKIGVVM